MGRPRARAKVASKVKTDERPWPYVEVKWHDALAESAWKEVKDLPKLPVVTTRGWLVHKDKSTITVAATLIDRVDDDRPQSEREVGEIISIPRGCIIPPVVELTAKRGKRVRL